jgi:hypothetical protein
MAGRVLDLESFIQPDRLGTEIANQWHEWNMRRQPRIAQWREVREYVYATDTSQTSNRSLPWKNSTTIPKLTQIRDNLVANYMATLFPRRKWLRWIGDSPDDNSREKREAIVHYMGHVIDQPRFKEEITKCILDYIDYGNAMAMPEWVDETVEIEGGKVQAGYVGPMTLRLSPLDIVFNPIAPSFRNTPKIVRSLVSLGEVKAEIEKVSTDENRESMQKLWAYLKDYRSSVNTYGSELTTKNDYFSMDGFDSFTAYLKGSYAEVLTFYGDIYDQETDTLLKNYVIKVVDRHKIIDKRPNPSYFGTTPIRHVGWRPRQDNIWAMGPLDNLVGMQYRLNHIENLKADLLDLFTLPPLEVKGDVEEFQWGPLEKIFVGEEGKVTPLWPTGGMAQASNMEISQLIALMEEMAGAPKEALGFRSPGEKTAYEVQRLENAASRIFQHRIAQFEEQFLEPHLNDLLELAKRNMSATQVRVFDDELKFYTFMSLTSSDISGSGRIRPIGARHFAEQSQMLQNVTNFYQSAIGQDQMLMQHFSTIKTAQLIEDLLNIQEYELVQPFVRLSEQADSARLAQSQEESVLMEAQTATGIEGDYDMEAMATQGLPEELTVEPNA